MPLLKDMDVLDISHKYSLSPGGMKAQAFALFERGYSTRDVGYLLRRLRNGTTKQHFTSTIRRYYGLWRAKQTK
ncbi:MAG: hypothetical protein HY529_00545 [Chloroflexi bacterium]|nr:hypothetical protein [Chloroflexota bacterium]